MSHPDILCRYKPTGICVLNVTVIAFSPPTVWYVCMQQLSGVESRSYPEYKMKEFQERVEKLEKEHQRQSNSNT